MGLTGDVLVADGREASLVELDVVLVVATVVVAGEGAAADVGLVGLALLLDARELPCWWARDAAGSWGWGSDGHGGEDGGEAEESELHFDWGMSENGWRLGS